MQPRRHEDTKHTNETIAALERAPKIVVPLVLGVDLDEALCRFEEDRTRLVGRLRELQTEDWTRAADHEEYNSYSVFTMCRHLALHDFFHAYRIEELLLRKDWPAPDVS